MSLPKCFLEGKTAIVTGASAGIGRAVARALANNGVNLVLAARSTERLQAAQQELIEQTGVKVLAVPCDVRRPHDLARLVDQAAAEFGRIDLLVNNAGISGFYRFEDLTTDEIDDILRTNLTSAVQLTRLVLPHMLRQGWGHVVNMASLAGKHGPPCAAAYAATKAGLIAFTQSLRIEFRGRRISASAICPGFTDNGGIYDAIRRDVGREPPGMIGSTTTDAVARAVVRAIRKDQPEVIVNSPPLRLFCVLDALFPRLGDWLLRKLAGRYFRAIGRARRRSTRPGDHAAPRAA